MPSVRLHAEERRGSQQLNTAIRTQLVAASIDDDTHTQGREMSLSAKIRRAPLRLTTGAFIFNSGVDHLKADEEMVGQLHEMAAGTYPFLGKVDPKLFTKMLAAGELAVGGLLLAPIVPLGLAGLALTGFAGGLIGLYARTPGLRRERSVFPTQQGLGFAKDTWLAAIGISLLADAVLAESPITSNDQSVPHRD